MKFLTLSLLSGWLIACTTPSIKNPSGAWVPKYQVGDCFVKWTDPEYKRKYEAGRGHSRVYMQKYDLLIPIWSNGGINIESVGYKEYGVKFDISDVHVQERVQKVMNDNFIYQASAEREIMTRMSVLTFRISEVELEAMLPGYEPVNCVQYLWSQIL